MAEKQDVKKENSGKSNKGVLVVLFILGLFVLGAATFGGVYLFMKTNNSVSAQQVVIENLYTDLGEFTVNLNDEGGKKYVKCQVAVGYEKKDKKTPAELTTNAVVVKDAIIFYLRNHDSEFVNDIANEEIMKKELIENINKELVKGKITDIRFSNFIVQ
ncbi:MAG: flagellar basal body protein FliL [Clostridium butyricum]|nr:flagellar basal body protein FliL [Clostridium butyricum]